MEKNYLKILLLMSEFPDVLEWIYCTLLALRHCQDLLLAWVYVLLECFGAFIVLVCILVVWTVKCYVPASVALYHATKFPNQTFPQYPSKQMVYYCNYHA